MLDMSARLRPDISDDPTEPMTDDEGETVLFAGWIFLYTREPCKSFSKVKPKDIVGEDPKLKSSVVPDLSDVIWKALSLEFAVAHDAETKLQLATSDWIFRSPSRREIS